MNTPSSNLIRGGEAARLLGITAPELRSIRDQHALFYVEMGFDNWYRRTEIERLAASPHTF